ncbi:MAG: glycosyltransferase family 1 protein [Candidatus Hydrogenedentota bacterium]|jgi:glycosyltransferase involved in cell wall biosynthesis|uniref:Glycosyltransferase n=1 Tax=Sumerlaea chitinivorans TaxID=2250252 RepID=A0A2Z4Y301_SUMC1|nr:Glycosyltransferase [Candidatus Sumerlaea chitinivorans]RMH24101.1 MAG: glycosyltransferase family 1 protein [Candidatus Hydrogenedentota bacterium]GIX44385.1 MAG: glycosyl transferase group 1 [Candidatus Sumerlaea sp.]
MRILITNSARKYIGEAAHCVDLARELRRAGHDALLVVRKGYELESRAQQAELPAVALNYSGSFQLTSDSKDLFAFHRLIREWRPDVIHCHRGKDHWLAAVHRVLFQSKIPIVRTRHVVVPMQRHILNRWLLRKATSQVIAVSQQAAASLADMANKVHVIYSAVDTDRFHPSQRDEGLRKELGATDATMPLIGLVARLQNVKGQHIFISAAAAVAKAVPLARFVLAGRGSQGKFDYLEGLIREYGIEGRTVLLGWVPQVERLLASLDISVIASLGSEGSSRIAYESMASGVPLVATQVGCLPEIIEDGVNGLLVPPGDPEALARAILRLLNEPATAHMLASTARERVLKHHTYERWIEEILTIYDAAIHDAQGRQ